MVQELPDNVTTILPAGGRPIDLEPRLIIPTEVPERGHARLDDCEGERHQVYNPFFAWLISRR